MYMYASRSGLSNVREWASIGASLFGSFAYVPNCRASIAPRSASKQKGNDQMHVGRCVASHLRNGGHSVVRRGVGRCVPRGPFS